LPEEPANRKFKWLEWTLRLIPAVSAVVAIVALLLALAARKKEIACTYLGASKLVSMEPGGVHPDVRMDFRGTPITSLYKLSFRFKNTDAAAIKHEDIREPLNLQFHTGAKLLNSTVEGTSPSGFAVSTALSADGSSATLDFPLLNPGDEIDLAVYLYNSDPFPPSFEGRIVDVKQLLILDTQGGNTAVLPFLHNTAVRKVLSGFLVFLYGLLSLAAFVGIFAVPIGYVRAALWSKNWKVKYDAEDTAWQEARISKLRSGAPSSSFDEDWELRRKRLREKGIPEEPLSFADTLWEMIGTTFVLIATSAIFATTAYLTHVALRS
jgi:hypothetical protein